MTNQTVIIIGGGVAGMSAAHLLCKKGFKVKLLEAESFLGGKAASERTEEGYPHEHSIRVYHYTYKALFSLLKDIPCDDAPTVFDKLSPVGIHLIHDTPPGFSVTPAPKNKLRRLWFSLTAQAGLMKYFIKRGANLNTLTSFLSRLQLQHCYSLKRAQKLDTLSTEEYMKSYQQPLGQDAWQSITYKVFSIMVGVAFDKNNAWLFNRVIHEAVPGKYMAMLNGPTSECFIEPWAKYLRSNGVEIFTDVKVSDFSIQNNTVTACKDDKENTYSGDYFVLAVPPWDARYLKEHTALNGLLRSAGHNNGGHGTLSPPYKSDEHMEFLATEPGSSWSNGVQIYLSDLPKTEKTGYLNLYMDSPWNIGGIFQGEGFWENIQLPSGCKYVFSATINNAYEPGIVHHKPFLECTPDEVRDEILAQCRLNDSTLFIGWHLDSALCYLSDEDIQKDPSLLRYKYHHQKNGCWLINKKPTYTPLPGDYARQPHAETSLGNLFMAGESCESHFVVPTMEKACETAYRAARAIEKKAGTSLTPLPYTYDTMHARLFRQLDNLLFKIFR